MKDDPLPVGVLAETVIETFANAGITEYSPESVAALLVNVAKWDGLLTEHELTGLRMVVGFMSPMPKGIDWSTHSS